MDYFNSTKKHQKRNRLQPSISAKYQSTNLRSRNNGKHNLFTKSTGKGTNPTNKISNLSEKRVSSAYMSNSNASKNNRTYKRLSAQKFGASGSKNDKENNSRANNKNQMKLSRHSMGGKLLMQSNLSSTGAYNSITKNYNETEKSTRKNSYAMSRNYKNQSSKSKPIYQISETGGSIENYSK